MSNYDTHDPNNTPDDNGWDGEYPISNLDNPYLNEGESCGNCDADFDSTFRPCDDCPERFTESDQELLDTIFDGMSDDEIAEWVDREIGDEDIPF